MRDRRLEEIRKRLFELREEILQEIREKNAEAAALIDEGVPDVGDQGVSDNLKEFLHLLGDAKREELMKVDEAIERIRHGTYGLCSECEEPIAIERLEVRPYTRHCVACKTALEKEENLKAGPGKGTV